MEEAQDIHRGIIWGKLMSSSGFLQADELTLRKNNIEQLTIS